MSVGELYVYKCEFFFPKLYPCRDISAFNHPRESENIMKIERAKNTTKSSEESKINDGKTRQITTKH